MPPDLRPCCQQALLDHYALCDARREDPPTGSLSPAPAVQEATEVADV